MKLIKENEIIIKKSRFIAYNYFIDSADEVKVVLKELKDKHKKANHFPYAYKVNNTAGKSDDKEPNGTAAMPIYGILEKNNIENTLIVVVRYFGGTKLGAGGLLRAYLNATLSVLK